MTINHPELSRRISVNRIGAGGMEQTIEADAGERRALAIRLRIPSIASFSCHFRLSPPLRGQVSAEAELRAEITQLCVVSLEPFEATVRERFALRFVPEGVEEDEIDPEALDELPFSGDMIDLGETASEQLALALDPYPRMPGIVLPPEIGVSDDAGPEPASPFAALGRLHDAKRSRDGGDH